MLHKHTKRSLNFMCINKKSIFNCLDSPPDIVCNRELYVVPKKYNIKVL